MPIPSPADFRNKTKKHSEVREMMAQMAESAESKADATTKANAAEANAKTYADTKANAAEANAKTYADNASKLPYSIVASNNKSEKMVGVTTAGTSATGYSISLTDKDKFSHLFSVKPSTTYTLLVKQTTSPVIREFSEKPESFQTRLAATAGSTLTLTNVVAQNGRYSTFTTGADTRFIVLNPAVYTDVAFVVCEGAYNEAMWQGFNQSIQEKTLVANVVKAEKIISPDFIKSKNLFEGYTFGMSIIETRLIDTEGTTIVQSQAGPTAANFKQYVGAYFQVEPNTTYTLSKQDSDAFAIALLKADRSNAKLIMRDSSLSSYTFTTASDDYFVYVQLSNDSKQPLVQLERGEKVTEYESRGTKFREAALPLGIKLTHREKVTDNMYLTLGTQTDKFRMAGVTSAVAPEAATTDTVLDNFYEPLRALFPSIITRNLLGRDSSDQYDVYEYVFSPDKYEQTIFITAGMHPTEIVTPFALGILLNEIYRNPSKHEGLAYLRNKVRICVIPVVNVWGMNQSPKVVPTHYVNSNAVNPSRNFPERWEQIIEDGPYNKKGVAPASEKETQHIMTVMNREKERLSFYMDLHTGQSWTQDTLMYWLEEDNFLRPVLENIVSMRNDIVRAKLGREPVNDAFETQRATQSYYPWRVLGIPAATIEYGAVVADNLKNVQTTDYVDLIFNCIHYALKADLKAKRKQVELNEHNKKFISLYNTLSGHNNVVNMIWSYAQLQTNLYDKLGLTKSVIGAASGSYSLVKYVHAPVGYKNTVVLSAGLRGKDTRKSVTELGFFAHKLMTDNNPHIVALRNSTRFIFIPCLNPHGYDNNIVNNANDVQPYLNFATSTQPESVVLRSFIDSETIDLFVDIDSLLNANKPSGYANLQVIHNAKADIEYSSIFSVLNGKYAVSNPANAAGYSTALVKSQIADYINSKGIAYTYSFFAQNVLPIRTTVEGKYIDYGYEANELAYCTEVLLNNIKEICQRRTLSKYLAN